MGIDHVALVHWTRAQELIKHTRTWSATGSKLQDYGELLQTRRFIPATSISYLARTHPAREQAHRGHEHVILFDWHCHLGLCSGQAVPQLRPEERERNAAHVSAAVKFVLPGYVLGPQRQKVRPSTSQVRGHPLPPSHEGARASLAGAQRAQCPICLWTGPLCPLCQVDWTVRCVRRTPVCTDRNHAS